MYLVAIAPGQEVLDVISRAAAERGVTDGVVVSLIGMVDTCAVSSMSRNDHKNDIVTEYSQPLELLGTGEIRSGTVHLHVVLSAEGNESISGHLVWANAGPATTNAYIAALN